MDSIIETLPIVCGFNPDTNLILAYYPEFGRSVIKCPVCNVRQYTGNGEMSLESAKQSTFPEGNTGGWGSIG